MLSFMEFIFDLSVSLDKRLYSGINNYIFCGVGWMGNFLVKLRDVSEGGLFTRHTNKVLVQMKT